MEIEELRVVAVGKKTLEVTEIWVVEGMMQFEKGDVLVYGQSFADTTILVNPRTVTLPGNYIEIYLVSEDARGREQVYAGHFDGDQLNSSDWLSNEGSYRANPC